MWGIYPVVARWLQTQPAEPLPSLRLTFYINAFACLALAAFVTLPSLALRSRRAASAASPEEKQPMVGTSAGGGSTQDEQPHVSDASHCISHAFSTACCLQHCGHLQLASIYP